MASPGIEAAEVGEFVAIFVGASIIVGFEIDDVFVLRVEARIVHGENPSRVGDIAMGEMVIAQFAGRIEGAIAEVKGAPGIVIIEVTVARVVGVFVA